MEKLIITLTLTLFLVATTQAANVVTIENATIEKVRLTNKWYGGGCLIFISPYAGSKWCSADWATLNCDDGKDSRPLRAYFLFREAKGAMDRRNLVDVTVNQSKIVNGFCSVDELVINKEKAVE